LGFDILGPLCDTCENKMNKEAGELFLRLTRKPTPMELAAAEMMNALRFARDNCPDEWDALMASHAGPRICTAWDHVRELLTAAGFKGGGIEEPTPVCR
jgi:hypothetical protein